MKPQPTRYAIRRRLIRAVLLLEVCSFLVFILLAVSYESDTRLRAFDQTLKGQAATLFGGVADADDPADNVMLEMRELHLPAQDLYDVQGSGGNILGRSTNWPAEVIDSAIPLGGRDGVYSLVINRKGYRFVLLHATRFIDPGQPGGGIARPVIVRYGAPVARVWHEVFEAVYFYAGASLVILTATGLMMALLLRRGFAPLLELAGEASRISAQQWEFRPQLAARQVVELAPLAEAIETTLQRLRRSFEQQRRLTSDAAHELKTGLAIAKSSLQVLAMRPRSQAEYLDGLEHCLEDSLRLEETVGKMLTLARVEHAGAVEPALQPACACDGAVCLRRAAEQLAAFAILREVTIKVDAPRSAMLRVSADDCQLVCTNLLLNAVQHSRPGGVISARLITDRTQQATLVILDQGEGISPQALPHVFEPFFRSEAARDRKSGGTGLGLAICKGIAEANGGSISMASEPGLGTEVRVEFRFATQAPAAIHSSSFMSV
jgi:signal transduction histidine kinase